MPFTEEQNAELAKPLNRAHVRPPAPGKYGEYVEGWHCIAEANRIFGFDGWDRQTVEMTETCRIQIGDKWRVGYMAKVRIHIGDTIRDGIGCGSGEMRNLADAVESAVKEAETDATKRALMTFGWQFGLALYDKSKANVEDEPDASLTLALDGIAKCVSLQALKAWTDRNWGAVSDEHVDAVEAAIAAQRKAIMETNTLGCSG